MTEHEYIRQLFSGVSTTLDAIRDQQNTTAMEVGKLHGTQAEQSKQIERLSTQMERLRIEVRDEIREHLSDCPFGPEMREKTGRMETEISMLKDKTKTDPKIKIPVMKMDIGNLPAYAKIIIYVVMSILFAAGLITLPNL